MDTKLFPGTSAFMHSHDHTHADGMTHSHDHTHTGKGAADFAYLHTTHEHTHYDPTLSRKNLFKHLQFTTPGTPSGDSGGGETSGGNGSTSADGSANGSGP